MPSPASTPDATIRALAEWRFTLRRFLRFSEEAAERAGLTPQQHQLLLQIGGAPEDAQTTIGYLAERLALRHHSVVELSTRCEEAGLLVRTHDPVDRRLVVLRLTHNGMRILRQLSADHAREIHQLGPELARALKRLSLETPEQS
ncbi:MAG TPA: MarR family transcriptional regulator [Granulicella sp.]